MKIAQITPYYEAVPPRLYGGTERVVAHLTDALVDLGHDVTLFASAEAETRARLIPVRDQAIRLDPAPLKSDLAAHMAMLSDVLKRADDFDVLHFHTDMIHFPGFLVDTLEEAVAAAGRAALLGRDAIRARFDLRFSSTAMARRYLDVYGDLLARRPFAGDPVHRTVTRILERATLEVPGAPDRTMVLLP